MPRTIVCRPPAELSAWLRAGVPAAEVEPFARHLDQCAVCSAAIDRLLADGTLAELLRVGPVASHPLVEQLMRRRRADPRTVTLGPADSGQHTGGAASAGDPATAFLSPARAPGELGWLAHYRILKKLGAGGMGVVFLAEDTLLERKVALKVMQPGLAADKANRDRFLREARAAAALTHDHVVTIHQVGEANGAPYLAMQLLQGESLEGYLRRHKKLSPGQICRIGREACIGLGAAHGRGLVHRDIKPANVWLEAPKGRVKILDFGLARSGTDAHLTGSGFILGTPAYMSPEQARAAVLDGRSDLWSVGVMLYLLCTGQLPFQGDDMISTLAAIALDQPPPPREQNPEVPEALSELVLQLLAKDREQRPKSAQEVIDRLLKIERALVKKSASGWRPSIDPTERVTAGELRTADAPRRPRVPLRVALAAGALAAAVLLGVIVILIKNKDGSSSRLEVPNDSTVSVTKDGKEVARVGPAEDDDDPGAAGGAPAGPPPPGTPAASYVTRGGHVQAPTFLSFTPDGQKLVGITRNAIVVRDRLGSELARQDITVVHASRNAPKVFALSPDGRTLAVAANGGKVTWLVLRDLQSGTELKVLDQGAEAAAQKMTFSTDGLLLAVGYADGKVRTWDLPVWKPTGEPLKVVSAVGGLAFSSSGLLAVGGVGGHLEVYEPVTHQTRFAAEASVEVSGLAFTAGGRSLVVQSRKEGKLQVWDLADGKRRLELPFGHFGGLALSPDGRFAAVSYTSVPGSGGPRLVDLTTGQTHWIGAQEHGGACIALAFSPDGRTLATSGNGIPSPTVKLWDVAAELTSRPVLAGWKSAHTEPGFALADAKTNPLLAFVDGGRTLLVTDAERIWRRPAAGGAWTSETYAAVCREQYQGEPRLAAPFPVRASLALAVEGTGSSRIALWGLNAAGPAPRQQAPTTAAPILGLAVSPAVAGGSEGAMVAAAYGKFVELWKLKRTELAPLARFDVPDASSVTFSPDTTLLAVGNSRGLVRLYDLGTGKPRWSKTPVAGNRVGGVAFSPDGRWLAANTTGARIVTVFDAATGATVARADGGNRQMAFSPDGRRLVFAESAGPDGPRGLVVMDLPSGRVAGISAREHTKYVTAVTFAPDGKTLLSLGRDGLLKTWVLPAELVAERS